MNKLICLLSLCFFIFASCTEKKVTEAPTQQETKEEKAPDSKAVQLAKAQLTAYNNLDLENFLIPFSDSVKVFNEHDFEYQGIEKMREGYGSWFGSLDTIHCEIANRISTGNIVIDHERIYFKRKTGEENTFEAIAIYKVGEGKIQEVTFVRPKWD